MSTSDGSNSSMGECDAPGSRVAEARGQCQGPQMGTIEGLPNDVLLEVFRFYLHEEVENYACQSWRTLVHVCQRWRFIVFSSPRHLNLRLRCTEGTRAREMLDVWPAFLPIVIQTFNNEGTFTEEGADNILAALEHNSRVHEFSYWGNLVPRFAAAMRRPFPEITYLLLRIDAMDAPTLPDSFLGGSAPRLRELWLNNVRVPGLQRILSSASDLVSLHLTDFPNSGFIPPDTMVACLSTMSRLEEFDLIFDPDRYRTDREPTSRSPPPLKRTVLPALTSLTFYGTGEYLEDFVARIDAPLVVYIKAVLSHRLFFSTSQLLLFIDRIEKFPLLYQADVIFFTDRFFGFEAHPRKRTDHDVSPVLEVSCYNDSNTQLSSLAQFFTSSSPLFSTIERLKISQNRHWEPFDGYQPQWLELLHPFLAVKDLYLSEEIALLVMPFLHLHTGVLPALQNLFVVGLQPSGAVQEVVGEFVAARLVSGHVVTVHRWERWRGDGFGA